MASYGLLDQIEEGSNKIVPFICCADTELDL